jgi:hypothetical protein
MRGSRRFAEEVARVILDPIGIGSVGEAVGGEVSDDRATVGAFHEAAIAAVGCDNGRPGLRPEYH